MVERRDTSVTRHAGGWIVLGSGLLLVCLWSAVSPELSSDEAAQGTYLPLSDLDADGSESDFRLPATRSSSAFPRLTIDINEAGEAELSCVAGVGPALARRIVEHRRRLGRFDSLDELEKIPGVGPQLLAQLTSAISPLPQSSRPHHVSQPHLASTESSPLASEATSLVGRSLQTTDLKTSQRRPTTPRYQSNQNEPLHD